MIICSDIDLVVYGKWDSLFLFTLEKVLRERGYVDLVFVKVFDKVFVSILEKLLNWLIIIRKMGLKEIKYVVVYFNFI